MKIWCTVIRKNGTYKSVPVKAGKNSFDLDKNTYFIRSYTIGKWGPFTILRSIFYEGVPEPLQIDVDEELKKAKLKIDSKAIKNLTNKKILDVFGDAEFTRLEQILIMIMFANIGLSAATLIILLSAMGVM